MGGFPSKEEPTNIKPKGSTRKRSVSVKKNIIAKNDKPNKTDKIDKTENTNELTENDLKLVRTTWNEIRQSPDFKIYGLNMMVKIFVNNPEIKYIWKFAANLKTIEEMRASSQLKSHGYNVFEAINAGVNSLDKVEALNILLIDLGTRHNTYGAKIEHFPIIGKALMETLEEALGDRFTKEVSASWAKIINYFVQQMSKGMGE